MTIDEQTLDLLKTFGPYLLSAVGFVLTTFLAAFAGLVRHAWKVHLRRTKTIADALEKLAFAVSEAKDLTESEHRKIWDAVQGVRADLQLAAQNAEHLKSGLLKAEGRIDSQCERIDRFLAATTVLSSKIDAIFKVLDAPKRATDLG